MREYRTQFILDDHNGLRDDVIRLGDLIHPPIGIYTGCYLYYFRTYYIAVRAGGKRIVEDM